MTDNPRMMTEMQEMVDSINVDRVFGPVEDLGDRQIIPIAAISYGFGMGFGPVEEFVPESTPPAADDAQVATAGGGGGGANARPIAYIEVGPEGTLIKPILDEQKVALAGILLGAWTVGWLGVVLKTLFSRR